MRKLGSKKRVAFVATVVAGLLIGGGVAVAYWTTTGGGTGTATTSNPTNTLVVTSTAVTGLYPGGPVQPINLNIDNSASTTGVRHVHDVAISAVTSDETNCPFASNYTVTNALLNGATGVDVPATATNAFTGGVGAGLTGATVVMNNTASNQNPCKGVGITFTFTTN